MEIKIGCVSKEKIDALSPLFLPGVVKQIKGGLPVTALVASDGDTAIGAIAGWADEGVFWIISLYVAPHYRGQGIGRRLVESLIPILSEDELNMSCDIVITSEEHETLVPFFETLGFIDETDENENTYLIDVSDIIASPFYKTDIGDVTTFDEIPEHVLRKAQKAASVDGLPLPAGGLTGKGVERALSTAQVINGEIKALVAVDRSCVGMLTLACAWGNAGNPGALAALLRASFLKVTEHCPDDKQFVIQTINDASAALVHAIAPNAKPIEHVFTKYIV